jgi:LAS superfamily LD-carboxypeptidase LdcB
MDDSLDFPPELLTGRRRDHLLEIAAPPCALHKEAVAPFLAMRAAASADGIELVAFSSFRDFDRQLAIWNGKFRGDRPIQDRAGRPIDHLAMSPAERVEAILWWSAMPGASRHHWGTDFDVLDESAMSEGYKLQVAPAEYVAGGVFQRLTTWLDTHMHAFGFFRPYATDRGGVRPEPWHLSYAPVATRAQSAFTVQTLRGVLTNCAIEGRNEVLAVLDRYFQSHVANVDPAPEEALLSPRLA